MHFPLVSIIIPIYKVENFVIRCLTSVKNQSYSAIECILVDDCGPDRSIEISQNFINENHLTHFRILKQPKNLGLSMARNAGIDEAKGEYLYFLDSDDEITIDAIKDLVTLAESTKAELTLGHCICVNEKEGWERDYFPINSKKDVLEGNEEILTHFVENKYPVMACDKLVRKDFIIKNQLYFVQDLFSQDVLWSFQSSLKLTKVAFLRKDTYIYYFHDASIIHNRGERHFGNWITIAGYMDRAVKEQANPEKKKLLLKYLIDFKAMTLQMNWKAQKNEDLWKRSYDAYSKLSKLTFSQYFSSAYTKELKKNNFFTSIPKNVSFKIFKWRYER
ncbi:glycosyltransferase [Chryseobacterium sp.]|uniref:glycosyltransferase n=1 Tax=Chryseobacterium sp. TaxID=1871047 RepID=UPI00388D7AFA